MGGRLNLQFSRIIVFPGRTITFYVTKTSRPAEHQVTKTENKNFAGGLCHFHCHLDSWTPESWLSENPHHTLDTDSKHKEPSGEPFSSPARNCHLAGTVTESSKGDFIILSSQLLQDGRDHSKTNESREYGPIFHTSFTVK